MGKLFLERNILLTNHGGGGGFSDRRGIFETRCFLSLPLPIEIQGELGSLKLEDKVSSLLPETFRASLAVSRPAIFPPLPVKSATSTSILAQSMCLLHTEARVGQKGDKIAATATSLSDRAPIEHLGT